MNCNVPYYKVFEDKNVMPIIAETAGVRTPEAVLTCSDGYYRDGDYNLMSRNDAVKFLKNLSSSGENEFFIKPTVGSSSGRGCRIIKLNDENLDEIINSAGQNFAVQKILHCHDDIAKIYPHSVNTFRIISYIWHDEVIACPIILRIGQGGNYVDNAHAGGMFIAVDNDGTMHEKAFTEFRDEFTEHPDTHLKFNGYKISGVPDMIGAAKRMHAMIPQVGIINWDFTIDKDCKPVLIEGNLRGGSIWLIEMAHGVGIFGENTAEILRWTRAMKKLKPHERIAMKNNFNF